MTVPIDKQLNEAAFSFRQLIAKGFTKEITIETVTGEYGVTAEQLAPFIVDVRNLDEAQYNQAKRTLLGHSTTKTIRA
jgi:hypothetical protein